MTPLPPKGVCHEPPPPPFFAATIYLSTPCAAAAPLAAASIPRRVIPAFMFCSGACWQCHSSSLRVAGAKTIWFLQESLPSLASTHGFFCRRHLLLGRFRASALRTRRPSACCCGRVKLRWRELLDIVGRQSQRSRLDPAAARRSQAGPTSQT